MCIDYIIVYQISKYSSIKCYENALYLIGLKTTGLEDPMAQGPF